MYALAWPGHLVDMKSNRKTLVKGHLLTVPPSAVLASKPWSLRNACTSVVAFSAGTTIVNGLIAQIALSRYVDSICVFIKMLVLLLSSLISEMYTLYNNNLKMRTEASSSITLLDLWLFIYYPDLAQGFRPLQSHLVRQNN